MTFTSRRATRHDLPVLASLIEDAITELQKDFLDPEQISSSRAIMGVEHLTDPAGGVPVPLVRMRKRLTRPTP